MLRAIWFLVKLAVVVAVAVWLAEHPGDLSFTWLGYRVDTSVAFLVVVMVALAVVFALVYRFWRGVVTAPRALSRYHYYNRRDKGYDAITKGLLAVAAGDTATARKMARRADAYLPEPPLARLLAAQTALMEGDHDTAHRMFEAMSEDKSAAFLGLRGLTSEAIRNKDWQAGLEYARRALVFAPKSDWALTTVFDLETRTGHWRSAEETLKKALRAGVIDRESWQKHRVALLLALSQTAEDNGDDVKAMQLAKTAHQLDRSAPHAALRYARILNKVGRRKAAVKVVERTWGSAPHPALADLWGELIPPSRRSADRHECALDRVKWYNWLARLNPSSVTGLCLAAEAELAANLWGDARKHLEKALENDPTSRVFRLLAQLERSENQDEDKAQYWLDKAETASPEKVWQCVSCGHMATTWQPLCDECGAFNTIEWGNPYQHMTDMLALAAAKGDGRFAALPIYG